MVNEKMVNEKMIKCLDVGTGSGCIAISLKKAHPEWSVTGIDISPEAIEVARENARRNNVDVHFEVADIFSDQMTKYLNKWYMVNEKMVNDQMVNKMVNEKMVNIVVSNPPYICESEKVSMKSNVLDYEPSTALFVPDSDPLLFYRRIAELFFRTPYTIHCTPKYLFFEINEAYGPQLSAMLDSIGYTNIQIHKDIYGKDRIIEARMAR
jgi:release factor glutamine methyltransferase